MNAATPSAAAPPPTVSVVMVCWNEKARLAKALDGLLATDYDPARFEIVIVDGMSRDGTRDIIAGYAARYPNVRCLDNPGASKPHGLNLGILSSQAEIIIRADCHALYPPNYISDLVRLKQGTGAANVGGFLRADLGRRPMERAIARSVGDPITAGNSAYRTVQKAMREVNTVFGGCYARQDLLHLGLYDERLMRTQDRELNCRLRAAGGRIVMDPSLVCTYFPRRRLAEHLQWTYVGARALFRHSLATVSSMLQWRNFVPLAWLAAQAAALLWLWLRLPLLAPALAALAAYALALGWTALRWGWQDRSPAEGACALIVIPATHFSYALGSLAGALRAWATPRKSAPPLPLPDTEREPETWPTVAILVPCRNERAHLAACLEQILAQDYPRDKLQVCLLDGLSDDGSRAIAEQYRGRDVPLRILDNPRRTQAAALNLGVRATRSEVVVRMDVRCHYPVDYVRRLVSTLVRHGASNVGALRLTAVGDTAWSHAVASLISHPFAAGNAHWRTRASGIREVDSVYCGCYARSVFNRIGGFDERWQRGEDREFNYRLRGAGGKLLLDSTILCTYIPRTGLGPYCRWTYSGSLHLFANGLRWSRRTLSWRNFVPLATCLAAIVLCTAAGSMGRRTLAVLALLYLGLAGRAAWTEARRYHRAAVAPLLLLGFPLTHFLYALGTAAGIGRALVARAQTGPGTDPEPDPTATSPEGGAAACPGGN
jgi:glycosyltransferase involved in cell wall biosynthesis